MSHQERGELGTLLEVREAGAGAGGGSSKRFRVAAIIAENCCYFLFNAQVMRLQKRKEEVRERLEAVRPKAEVKEEPLEDVSRSTVGKLAFFHIGFHFQAQH